MFDGSLVLARSSSQNKKDCLTGNTPSPPSFAGTPTLLPYGVFASVLSTHPIWTGSPPSSPHGVRGFAVSAPPASLRCPLFCLMVCLRPFRAHPVSAVLHLLRLIVSGDSLRAHSPASLGRPPARRPACLVPLTTGYTRSRLASCGVSVTSHTPSLEVRPRLSPHPGHDDWNPGQRGFQFAYMQ